MATELRAGPGVATPNGLFVRVDNAWVEMPTTLTPLGEALRNLCATKLAVIANRRQAQAGRQEHISRVSLADMLAAEVYDSDPHGDLSWRDNMELPY